MAVIPAKKKGVRPANVAARIHGIEKHQPATGRDAGSSYLMFNLFPRLCQVFSSHSSFSKYQFPIGLSRGFIGADQNRSR
ncbi:MAG: hypothetical protein HYX68_02235 [Planctomycetes bacterium]|nr:hypothetical protein [Planctomycetota bacterium]